MPISLNILLVTASLLNAAIALLHFFCIYWGPPGFRVLGAGEPIVKMAERGHWYPAFVAAFVGVMLLIGSLYALSGAGVIAQLPYAKALLSIITTIYLLRAVAFPLLKPMIPGNSDVFWWVSSFICLVFGLIHLGGLMQVWGRL